jgi:hypothetical protein
MLASSSSLCDIKEEMDDSFNEAVQDVRYQTRADNHASSLPQIRGSFPGLGLKEGAIALSHRGTQFRFLGLIVRGAEEGERRIWGNHKLAGRDFPVLCPISVRETGRLAKMTSSDLLRWLYRLKPSSIPR